MTQQPNLGDALSAALEIGPSRRALAAQRVRVLSALAQPERSPRSYLAVGACAAVALTVALLASHWTSGPSVGALRGAWQGKTLSESATVVAPAEREETLSFSDGS